MATTSGGGVSKRIGTFIILNHDSLEDFVNILKSIDLVVYDMEYNGHGYLVTGESPEFDILEPFAEPPLYNLEVYKNKTGKVLVVAEKKEYDTLPF